MPKPIEVSLEIGATAARVWEVMTDIDSASTNLRGITSLQRLDGTTGFDVGTRWRETRVISGKSVSEQMTVTVVEHGRSYTAEVINGGVRYLTSLTVEPTGSETCTLVMSFAAAAGGFGQTVLSSVFGRVMANSTRKMMQGDLADIAVVAEGHRSDAAE